MADTLANADMQEKGNEMLYDSIDQLQCIVSAEELAGRSAWTDILETLQLQSEN